MNQKINDLVALLTKAKEDYYLTGTSDLSDSEFDALEEQLRKLDPKNDYFQIVGVKNNKQKIKHLYAMRSLDKDKTVEGVEKWMNKISTEKMNYVIMPKIDGLSASIVYENGKLKCIATRGDGVQGQDITHVAQYLNIPKTIDVKTRYEVRGELVLFKGTSIPNPENKALRNLAVGIVGRKESSVEDLKQLKFVAYFVIGSKFQSLNNNIGNLKMQGFSIVDCYEANSIQQVQDYFGKYLSALRNDWLYQTDGLVISVDNMNLYDKINSKYTVSHHNFWAFALKPPSEGQDTVIRDIEWSVSKSGNIIPVAFFDTIEIGGASVCRATLNNYQNVKNIDIHINDVFYIERANEVIPFVKEKVISSGTDANIPAHCPCCKSKLVERGVHLACMNKDCVEQKIQIIISWVKNCQLDGVSEMTIRILYKECNVHSIADLYKLARDMKRIDCLYSIEGFGKKKVEKLISEINNSRNISIAQFLGRLSIDLVGEKAIKKLGIKSLADFWKFSDTHYVIGQNIVAYRESHAKELKELISELMITEQEEKEMFYGKRVAMTGKGPATRDKIITEIENMGFVFDESITKETSILVCENVLGESTKLAKARKMGIELVSYNDFFGKID